MPDKIWLHKDTKYNTGDIVCGYQYEFAEGIEDEGGIKNFVEYVPKDTFIEKAVEWIKEHKEDVETEDNGIIGWIPDYFIEDFRNYMKGE
jgi:hypothetical protein